VFFNFGEVVEVVLNHRYLPDFPCFWRTNGAPFVSFYFPYTSGSVPGTSSGRT
jgi:hypothetical protein